MTVMAPKSILTCPGFPRLVTLAAHCQRVSEHADAAWIAAQMNNGRTLVAAPNVGRFTSRRLTLRRAVGR